MGDDIVEPAEVETTTTETTPTETTSTVVQAEVTDNDALIERIADRVFDKMKVFSTDLITASQNAQQIVAETMPIDTAPPPDVAPTTDGEPSEDVRPQRRHKLFAQPMKRNG